MPQIAMISKQLLMLSNLHNTLVLSSWACIICAVCVTCFLSSRLQSPVKMHRRSAEYLHTLGSGKKHRDQDR